MAIFKLSELKALYHQYLSGPVNNSKAYLHSTRFKDRILHALPYLSAYQQGRDIFLISEAQMGSVVYKAYEDNDDEEAFGILKTCNTMRKIIFSHLISPFTGTFDIDCQTKSIPPSLTSMISLLLYGSAYSGEITQEVLTISQLIMFNTKAKNRSSIHRHSKTLEMPLPIYIGFQLHSEFRCSSVIQKYHKLGISVSYNRILEIEKDLLRASCTQYNNEGWSAPAN